MSVSCVDVPLPRFCTGVVVRPARPPNTGRISATSSTSCSDTSDKPGPQAGGPAPAGPQTLIFFGDEARELLEAATAAAAGAVERALVVSPQALPIKGQLRSARHPIYDPATDAVVFVEGYAVKRLGRDNTVSLVAGREGDWGFADGAGGAARFRHIVALTCDGAGGVFAAEKKAIRALDSASGEVTTLRGSEPAGQPWISLSYDAGAGMLVAATSSALYHFPPSGAPYGGGCGAATRPRVIAGIRNFAGEDAGGGGEDDGSIGSCSPSISSGGGGGKAARFSGIRSILAAPEGTVLVGELGQLRVVDAFSGAVTSHPATGANEGYFPWQLALLPGARLAMSSFGVNRLVVLTGAMFTAANEQAAVPPPPPITAPAGAGKDQAAALAAALLDLLALPSGGAAAAGAAAGAASTVSIIARDGKIVVAHRGVLAVRSDYFKRLFSEDGGGAGSAVEVRLPHADPEVLGRLLVYMYTGELDVPVGLLRPATDLARQLLLPAECIANLQARLLATVTPGSVVSDLVWAEQHGMAEVVAHLRAYMLRNRREVAAEPQARMALLTLITQHPQLTAELILTLMAM